jgi:hypothetical protein
MKLRVKLSIMKPQARNIMPETTNIAINEATDVVVFPCSKSLTTPSFYLIKEKYLNSNIAQHALLTDVTSFSLLFVVV